MTDAKSEAIVLCVTRNPGWRTRLHSAALSLVTLGLVTLGLVQGLFGGAVLAAPPGQRGNAGGTTMGRNGAAVPGAPLPRATGNGAQVAPLNSRLGSAGRWSATDAVPDRGQGQWKNYGALPTNRPTTEAVSSGMGRTTGNVIGQYKNAPVPGGLRRGR